MSLEVAAGLLACPVCGAPLRLSSAQAACPAGHRFDVARHGYLNLLGAAQPANADTPAMLAARQRVLDSGAFDPVAAALADGLAEARTFLDAGAGTGWYGARCLTHRPEARAIASDVSVAAARLAARAHPRLASVVADTWRRLPVLDAVLDGLLSVFAPRNAAEFARVLRPGGLLLIANPEPEHLIQLRERYALLGIEPDKGERLERSLADAFTREDESVVGGEFGASGAQVADLVAMGPNAFHAPVVGDAAAAPVTIAVRVTRWRRR